MTSWAHLPNAVHIDRVLASALANEYRWVQVRTEERGAAWDAAWHTSWLAARSVLLAQSREAAWSVARDASWAVARDAILALVAYDDCAYMLDSDPGELAILAAFGDPRAILLLPACKVFHALKELA